MEPKTQRLPMPQSEARLQETVLLLLRLPQLLELRIQVQGIEVRRAVNEDEDVVPETILEIARGTHTVAPDLSFLLSRLELEPLVHDPARHQLTTLMKMMEQVREQGLFPCGWYAAHGDGLDAFLAQPSGTLTPWLFAVPVHYVPSDQLPEGTLLLVGSNTRHSIDAVYGVTADIGG
jgi:hypothetical protein